MANASRSSIGQPKLKRNLSALYPDTPIDITCPICLDTIHDAFVTRCGHSFCYNCISRALQDMSTCPKCCQTVTLSELCPNHTLEQLLISYRQSPKRRKLDAKTPSGSSLNSDSQKIFNLDDLDLSGIDRVLEMLAKRKSELQSSDVVVRKGLLCKFLEHLKDEKESEMRKMSEFIKLVDEDLQSYRPLVSTKSPNESSVPNLLSDSESTFEPPVDSGCVTDFTDYHRSVVNEKFSRLAPFMNDLEHNYFNMRRLDENINEDLEVFASTLSKMTRFSQMHTIARFSYSSDSNHASTIVSGVDFDKDNAYFATAGVCKKIKIYDYYAIVGDESKCRSIQSQNHEDAQFVFPISELTAPSKLSCVCWSPYIKNHLVSCDYDGVVILWDVNTGDKSRSFVEHQKRCWSVDFNRQDPKMFASASDDHKVKIWTTDKEKSCGSFETTANVCAVAFNPDSSYYFVCGCADHSIYYADTRSLRTPLMTLKGHKKAVSYTKFLDCSYIVSASTDSSLRLWNLKNLKQSESVRVFKGHLNEKNFVGLATNGEFIACGSESNCLYVYHRDLPRSLFSSKLADSKNHSSDDNVNDAYSANEFVSAVCWKSDANVVVSANSLGIVKILEMTS